MRDTQFNFIRFNVRHTFIPRLPDGKFGIIKQADNLIVQAVVNVDSRESDTRPLALENLKGGENSAVTVLRGDEDLALTGQARELWPQLAGAAAVLLALEMLLLAFWRSPKTAAGSQRVEGVA